MTRSCDRRSFDAATIFIAFVICCVDLTLRIRRSLAQTEEKLEQVMKLRSRLVVGTVMPK